MRLGFHIQSTKSSTLVCGSLHGMLLRAWLAFRTATTRNNFFHWLEYVGEIHGLPRRILPDYFVSEHAIVSPFYLVAAHDKTFFCAFLTPPPQHLLNFHPTRDEVDDMLEGIHEAREQELNVNGGDDGRNMSASPSYTGDTSAVPRSPINTVNKLRCLLCLRFALSALLTSFRALFLNRTSSLAQSYSWR